MDPEVLAKVIRGETVESIHRGHFIVIDGDGRTVASAGDPETVTFLRSSAKPFQAMPFIISGAADAFGFSEDEIAMACASHSGEPFHIEIVARMLTKIGLDESDLRCGAHLPFNEQAAGQLHRDGAPPNQLHNNCSGKHAAMLAVAKHLHADLKNYESPASPVQRAVLRAVSNFAGVPQGKILLGVDGCAAPNFAIPISAMARSFMNLITPPDTLPADHRAAAGRITSAMLKFPKLIGGTWRLDTLLMEAAPGTLISKVGADGVWLCAVLPGEKWKSGLAIALKIEDGDDTRARPVVAVEILRQLGILTVDQLKDLSPMQITNRRGDRVGSIESVFTPG